MPVVDFQFPVRGGLIAVDHGYLLSAAISRIIPTFHGDETIGIHHIPGELDGGRLQRVGLRSFLTIRLPHERIKEALPLAGKALIIGEQQVRLGVPSTRALVPSPRLYSRLVVIKGFMEPGPFLEAVQRQLDAMQVKGIPSLVDQSDIALANQEKTTGTRSPFLRRTIRIRDKEIVGFALSLTGLTAEESVLVQERGIGGRRRFGCGIFVPVARDRV